MSNCSGGEKGFLVFVPLFVDERFDGYITGTFWIQQLLEPLLADHASLGYSIALIDGEEEVINNSEGNRPDHPEWLQETEVEVRNVTWRIQVWPKPELVAKVRSSLPEVALGAGLMLALLMSLTIRLAQKKMLYASGYASHPMVRHYMPQERLFLSKPFNSETLMRTVRKVLDAPKGEGKLWAARRRSNPNQHRPEQVRGAEEACAYQQNHCEAKS